MRPFALILALAAFPADVLAEAPASGPSQPQPSTLEARIPQTLLNERDSFFTLVVENDFFGSGTDQNFTNGLRLTYFDVGTPPPLPARWFEALFPYFDINRTTSTYYSAGQNLYTPENIDLVTPDPTDRPYAAFLYGSAGLVTIEDNHLDNVELTLGVIGPLALGEEVQANFHEWIDSKDPRGWDSQLDNEPGLMVSWQRTWPEAYATRLAGGHYLRVMPHLGLTLGNIHTHANTGLTVQLMPWRDRWQSQPLRVRPAVAGSGFFSTFEHDWSWMVFAGADGRAVGRNIFLDGNTFEDSPSVDKRPLVADLSAGLALTYGRTRLSYTLNWRSEEFENQDTPHIFGALSLGYRF